jgi:penicillin-binding protein 1A
VPFRVPPGIKLIRVDLKSGVRAGPGTERAILEAFKPGTAPPDNYSVVGYGDSDSNNSGGGQPPFFGRGVPPDAGGAVRRGTGGLY